MKNFISIFTLTLCLFSFKSPNHRITSNVYSYQFTSLSGEQIHLSSFEGKKMLFVNIASESQYAHIQIPQLEILNQLYKDSLIIIGFSSNDFGHEPHTNTELNTYLSGTYSTHFHISTLINVKIGTQNLHPLYSWLQDENQNGSTSAQVTNDFCKYLFDKEGNIVGAFSGDISPLDNRIMSVIIQQ